MLDRIAPRFAPIRTALGDGLFAYTSAGVIAVETGLAARAFARRIRDRFGTDPIRKEPPPSYMRALRAAIARGDGSMVDWSPMPGFQRRVLEATAAIPVGSVRSYGQIADAIGSPRAMRAVGTALARNPVPLLIPCHRVVRSDGSLGQYGMGGIEAKRRLLAAEGAEIA